MWERKLAIVGIDGFSPEYMNRYLQDGKLAGIGDVARCGVQVPLFSTLPACTPVAWATMATGAPPSITGIEGFLLHRPGDRLDQRISGCYAHRCHAEPIWATAQRHGKKSYVVKFPLSYPSTDATFRLDGAAGWGGLKCLHEAASSSVGASSLAAPGTTVIDADEGKWLHEDRIPGQITWRGVWRLRSLWQELDIELYVAQFDCEQTRRVAISASRDASQILTHLAEGQWSDPLTVLVPSRRGLAACSFRVKALNCAAHPLNLSLLNTTLHERNGHSYPDDRWMRHLDAAGPIEEQTEPSLVFDAGLDLKTQMEIFRLNSTWLQRVSSSLLRHEAWDLFMVQIHIVDWAHHLLHGKIDSRHPDYNPADTGFYEQLLLDTYRMADQLVSTVAESIGPDVDLIVLGDHGQDLRHSSFCTNEWLAAAGLLEWRDGGASVNWAQTKAYATGNYIYLNIEGRDTGGIVPVADSEELLDSIIANLQTLEDPATGVRPILVADRKNRFRNIGGDGVGVGDIVFCCNTGYQATNGRGPVLSRTHALKEFTSGHDHFWPHDPRIQTKMFAAGPSFRRGYERSEPARLIDVAPTVCKVLGIPAPAQCQGSAIPELYSEHVTAESLTGASV